jgi:hypothetical protein
MLISKILICFLTKCSQKVENKKTVFKGQGLAKSQFIFSITFFGSIF